MKDDYLWDRLGKPDPEIQRLETLLGRFRHSQPAPDFPAIPEAVRRWTWPWFLGNRALVGTTAVAVAVLVVGSVWFAWRRTKPPAPSASGWEVVRVAGTPYVGTKAVGDDRSGSTLGVGQTLVTDAGSRASLTVDEIGDIEVEPDTRLRLLQTGSAGQRLALDRGTIRAAIWAPPGDFVVDTPSAVAVDMGCAYTLHVDDSGSGLLRTTLGWVGFKLGGHESFIPAGAACATRPGIGPGTPYFEDASGPFRTALSQFDFGSPERRSAELGVVLAQARQRDALTLWHLLARADEGERGRVYDRLAALVPPPAGVSRAGILSLDQTMLDLWWNKLGLGDVSLWRTWERSWVDTQRRK
jgi:FecR protein